MSAHELEFITGGDIGHDEAIVRHLSARWAWGTMPSAFAATGALESVVLAVILLVKLHRRHSRAAGVGWRLTKTPPASA